MLCSWLRAHNVKHSIIANGGVARPQYRMKLKRMGLQPGFPDLIIMPQPPDAYSFKAVAIEMKRKRGGVVSDEQWEWIRTLRDCGWEAHVATGADHAISILRELGIGK